MYEFKIKLKLFIKKIFNKFGLQVSRVPYNGKSSSALTKIKVGNYHILINGNHNLPFYMRSPFYSTNLPRLATCVKDKYENLTMVDVGANIGDTVAFCRSKSDFPIVCIEGDDDFYSILQTNLASFKNVSSFKCLLGEVNSSIDGVLKKNDGSLETARIINTIFEGKKNQLNIITLDSFFVSNPQFKGAKLLKIDTDGYDLKIIRGGLEYIKQIKPVLFFEYDTVFLAEQGDDGVSTLLTLEGFGYKDAIFYDNGGRFVVSIDLHNHLQLRQLHNLIDKNYRSPFPFYDIVLFHEDDADIARKFISSEMKFFYNIDV